jgi:F-type H+-transporting ATPase subunit b
MKRLSILLALTASPALAATGPFFSLGNTDFVVLLGFLAFVSLLVYLKVPGKTDRDARCPCRGRSRPSLTRRARFAKRPRPFWRPTNVARRKCRNRLTASSRRPGKRRLPPLNRPRRISRSPSHGDIAAATDQIASAEAAAVRQVREQAVNLAVAAAADVLARQMTADGASRRRSTPPSRKWMPSCTEPTPETCKKPGAHKSARVFSCWRRLALHSLSTTLLIATAASCSFCRAMLIVPFGAHLVVERLPRHSRDAPSTAARAATGSRACTALLIARCWSSKMVARHAVPEHHLSIVEHALLQQIEHRSQHVQHDDVVARLDDCHVELGIQLRLIRRVAFLVGATSILAKIVSITFRSVSDPSRAARSAASPSMSRRNEM